MSDNNVYIYRITVNFGVKTPIFVKNNSTDGGYIVDKEVFVQAAFSEADNILRFIRSFYIFEKIRAVVKRQSSYIAELQLINSLIELAPVRLPFDAAYVLFQKENSVHEFGSLVDEVSFELFKVPASFAPECLAFAKMIVSAVIFSETHFRIKEANSQHIAILQDKGKLDAPDLEYLVQPDEFVPVMQLDYVKYERSILEMRFAPE